MKRARLLLLGKNKSFGEELAGLLANQAEVELVTQSHTREEALFLIGHYAINLVLLDFEPSADTYLPFIVHAAAAGYKGKVFLVAEDIDPIDSALLREQNISGIFLKHDSPARFLMRFEL